MKHIICRAGIQSNSSVDEWVKIKDEHKNILEYFYEDQKKWAFPFQMNTFISRVNRIEEIKKNNPQNINIIERSVYTDKNCFASNCYEMGNMTKIEYEIYNNWHTWLCNSFSIKPSAFIYLYTDPEVSSKRIEKRNRSGEETIPLDYLKKLHNLHEIWMKNEVENKIPVLYINCTDDLYENKEQLINKINMFLTTNYMTM